jgi:hypothetical protein
MEPVVHSPVDVFPKPDGGFYTDDIHRGIRIHAGSYCCIRTNTVCNIQNESTLVFWDVTPSKLVVRHRHYGHNSCFHLQNTIVSSSSLKDVGIRILWNFGTFYQTTWYHIIVDTHLGTTTINSNHTHN